MSNPRQQRRKQLRLNNVQSIDYEKIKRSLQKEIERTAPTTFWGKLVNCFVPTRAERKMEMFLKEYYEKI